MSVILPVQSSPADDHRHADTECQIFDRGFGAFFHSGVCDILVK